MQLLVSYLEYHFIKKKKKDNLKLFECYDNIAAFNFLCWIKFFFFSKSTFFRNVFNAFLN